MAKRFTDTEKWDRPWFRGLPLQYKLLWIFILDRCDIAGVWYVDMGLAAFQIGFKFDRLKAEKVFEKQIQINGERWLIKDFIPFQYGSLEASNKVYRSVSAKLLAFKEGALEGHISPSNGSMVMVMDKEKDKEGGVGETNELVGPSPEDLVKLWNKDAHPNLPRVKFLTETRKRHAQARLEANPDQTFWEQVLSKVNLSPLLRGDQGGWKANFDWILNPSNLAKVVEGNYDANKYR